MIGWNLARHIFTRSRHGRSATQMNRLIHVGTAALLAAVPSVVSGQCEHAKILASDGRRFDQFGSSVAIHGDMFVVGAEHDTNRGLSRVGSAYVYRLDPITRQWVEEAKLEASDGVEFDEFGCSIDTDGEIIVVGAKASGSASSGAAYVFQRDENTGNWIEIDKLVASDGVEDEEFGISVSLSADGILVGAFRDEERGIDAGAAYVFREGLNGNWFEEVKLIGSDVSRAHAFGYAVALDGEVALIGARSADDAGFLSGAAYIFRKNLHSGQWVEEAKLVPAAVEELDEFGASVTLSGNVAIIGAQEFNSDGPGAAYVYRFDEINAEWDLEQRLEAAGSEPGDVFSFAMDLNNAGDRAVISLRHDSEFGFRSGSVSTWEFNGFFWDEMSLVFASDPGEAEFFGDSVAIDGEVAIIGANNDNQLGDLAGAAYVFADLTAQGMSLLDPLPGRAGEMNAFLTMCGRPGVLHHLVYGLRPGSTGVPGCPGVTVSIASPQMAGTATSDNAGSALWTLPVPMAAQGREVFLQAVDAGDCRVSNPVAYLFD